MFIVETKNFGKIVGISDRANFEIVVFIDNFGPACQQEYHGLLPTDNLDREEGAVQ